MTLRKMLDEIDFDYEIENGAIRLIDNQGAYLGDIDEERWNAAKESVPLIIDRLDIYWHDYIYAGITDPLMNESGEPLEDYEDNGSYEELLKYCRSHGIENWLTEILYYIIHPDKIIFEEVDESEV